LRNTIKGKNKRPKSNKATGRDYTYDKEYQKSPERVKYRSELNKANRKAGTYGNKDGLDMSHTTKGTLVMEPQSKNRARNQPGKTKKKV
jgi:hypothetical protein